MTSINALIAAEHNADLRRDSDRRRAVAAAADAAEQRSATSQTEMPIVALRLAQPDESAVVRGLAALDDAPALSGPALLALVDGEAVAALSLDDGRIVANPFLHTEAAVGLLRLRARQESVPRRPRRRIRTILRPRFA